REVAADARVAVGHERGALFVLRHDELDVFRSLDRLEEGEEETSRDAEDVAHPLGAQVVEEYVDHAALRRGRRALTDSVVAHRLMALRIVRTLDESGRASASVRSFARTGTCTQNVVPVLGLDMTSSRPPMRPSRSMTTESPMP